MTRLPFSGSALIALAGFAVVAAPARSLDAQSANPACGNAGAVVGQAGSAPDQFGAVRDTIMAIIERNAVPSVAVAVARHGKIVWEAGFGCADRERGIAATAHTPYSLASISKPITATGLMKLVERGAVQLDRPINEYLGAGKLSGLAGDVSGATVRRVLSHTAGLPLHYQFFYADGGYARPSMDTTISRYGIVANPPGEIYQYSNLGFGLIDHVIARVSGRSYADFMRDEVFIPLGMTRSSVDIAPELAAVAAQRYDSRMRAIPFYTFDHPGGSAIYSSAHDLALFGMFHLKQRVAGQRRILADSTIDVMRRIHTPDTIAGYGLGWAVTRDDNGHLNVSHTGGMPGVATVLNTYPQEGLVIAVLTNRSDAAAFRIAQDIAAALLPRYAAVREARRARVTPSPMLPVTFPTPELLGSWSGTLRTYDGSVVPLRLVVQADRDIHVLLGDELATLMNGVTWRGTNLVGRFAGTIPTDEQRRHRHSILLNLNLRGTRLSGQASAQTTTEPVYYALSSYVELSKMVDLPIAAAALASYEGTYQYTNGPVRRAYVEGGRLFLEGAAGPRALLHQGDHSFVAADDPAVRITFRFGEGSEGRATGLTLNAPGQVSEARRVELSR